MHFETEFLNHSSINLINSKLPNFNKKLFAYVCIFSYKRDIMYPF